MRPPRFLPTGHGGGTMSGPGFTRPDLCSIRAATGQAESADAIPRLHGVGDCPLVRDDLLAALARDVACTSTEAGVLHASGCPAGGAAPQARAPSSAGAVSGQERDDDHGRSVTRQPPYDAGERLRPRHPPVHGGSRARRGGHRGLCLLLACLRGRPGPRRERDHRPAGACHDRRPGVRLQYGHPVRGTAPGTGPLPWPAGCSAWASRPP